MARYPLVLLLAVLGALLLSGLAPYDRATWWPAAPPLMRSSALRATCGTRNGTCSRLCSGRSPPRRCWARSTTARSPRSAPGDASMTSTVAAPTAEPPDRVLRLIALFKFCKALLLVVVGLGALELLDPDMAARAQRWVAALASSNDRHVVQQIIALVGGLSPRRLQALGVGAFLYAALFTVEGV